jgi:hypothetical protein
MLRTAFLIVAGLALVGILSAELETLGNTEPSKRGPAIGFAAPPRAHV